MSHARLLVGADTTISDGKFGMLHMPSILSQDSCAIPIAVRLDDEVSGDFQQMHNDVMPYGESPLMS